MRILTTGEWDNVPTSGMWNVPISCVRAVHTGRVQAISTSVRERARQCVGTVPNGEWEPCQPAFGKPAQLGVRYCVHRMVETDPNGGWGLCPKGRWSSQCGGGNFTH